MKFLCTCGYTFIDQTDNLPFKGHIYPEQSIEKLYDAIENIFAHSRPKDDIEFDRMTDDIISPKGGRRIYQCPKCGIIYIEEDNGMLSSFLPESDKVSKNLLKG